MTQAYATLIDDEPTPGFDLASNAVLKAKVIGTLKSVASTGWGIGFSLASIPVVGSLPALVSAVKTRNHIVELEKLRDHDLPHRCTCENCTNLIEYAITQKQWKLGKKVVSVIPVAGTVAAVGSKARWLYKWGTDTLGKARWTAAVALWHSGKDIGCPKAKAVVIELLGSQKKANDAFLAATGYELIAKKLASS